jgi:hypothetical protein
MMSGEVNSIAKALIIKTLIAELLGVVSYG